LKGGSAPSDMQTPSKDLNATLLCYNVLA